MRSNSFILTVALVAAMLAPGAARARCADDLAALQARVDRAQRMKPTAQTAAAAKVLQKFNAGDAEDEIDCYNAVARARRALAAAAPDAPAQQVQPLQVQPLQVQPLQVQK